MAVVFQRERVAGGGGGVGWLYIQVFLLTVMVCELILGSPSLEYQTE